MIVLKIIQLADVKPVNSHDFAEAIKQIGIFWVELNELPSKGVF